MDKRKTINNLQGEIWTEDDPLLAETVLRNVREGRTVKDAFNEFEVVTDGRRTAAAAKYRWFTNLVHQYKAGYELARETGKKKKETTKKRVNQGERYEQILENVLNRTSEENDAVGIDDILLLVKKYKSQEAEEKTTVKQKEKEIKLLEKELNVTRGELKEVKDELKDTKELLECRTMDYNNMLQALTVLQKAGISINIPEPSRPKYSVGKDGIIEVEG